MTHESIRCRLWSRRRGPFQEGDNHVDLLLDMIGRLGLDLGGEHIETFAIGVKDAGPVFGDFSERFAFFEGAFDGFVVDVGQVAYVEDFVAGDL